MPETMLAVVKPARQRRIDRLLAGILRPERDGERQSHHSGEGQGAI